MALMSASFGGDAVDGLNKKYTPTEMTSSSTMPTTINLTNPLVFMLCASNTYFRRERWTGTRSPAPSAGRIVAASQRRSPLLLRCVRYRYHLGSRIPLDIQCECFRDKPERKECSSTLDDRHDLGIGVDVDRRTIELRYVLANPQLQRLAFPHNGDFLRRRVPNDGPSGGFND